MELHDDGSRRRTCLSLSPRTCCRANGAKESAQGGPSLGECCPGDPCTPTALRKDRALNGRGRTCAMRKADHARCRPVRHLSCAPSERGLRRGCALCQEPRACSFLAAPWADSCGPLARETARWANSLPETPRMECEHPSRWSLAALPMPRRGTLLVPQRSARDRVLRKMRLLGGAVHGDDE